MQHGNRTAGHLLRPRFEVPAYRLERAVASPADGDREPVADEDRGRAGLDDLATLVTDGALDVTDGAQREEDAAVLVAFQLRPLTLAVGVLQFEGVAKTFRYLDEEEIAKQRRLAKEAKDKAGKGKK